MSASALAGCGGKKVEDDETVTVEFYSTTKEADEVSYNIYTKNFTDFEEYYKTAYPAPRLCLLREFSVNPHGDYRTPR